MGGYGASQDGNIKEDVVPQNTQPTVYGVVVVMLLLALFPLAVKAQVPTAAVEVRVEPEGDLALKQRGELVVRFLTDGFAFAKVPDFPNIRVDGALVIPPTSGMNFSERRGGETWIGIERRYSLYPTRPGEITVPALTIAARIRGSGGVADVEATSEPMVRQVIAPEELIPYPNAVVTLKLTLSQQYVPDVNELKVGDALKRTITVTADGTVSMLLPILSPAEIDGLATYPAQPVLNDREYRGSLAATRTDSATYIAQQEGLYELPEMVVYWWDPKSERLQKAEVPGLSFKVVANPLYVADQNDLADADEAGTGIAKGSRRNPTAAVVIILIISSLACASWWLYRRYGQTLRGRWTAHRLRRAESEKTHFAEFRRACLANDPGRAHGALLTWLQRTTLDMSLATLDAFVRETGDPELARIVAELNARLFGKCESGSTWRGQPLLNRVSLARRTWLQKATGPARGRNELAPLNPAR